MAKAGCCRWTGWIEFLRLAGVRVGEVAYSALQALQEATCPRCRLRWCPFLHSLELVVQPDCGLCHGEGVMLAFCWLALVVLALLGLGPD